MNFEIEQIRKEVETAQALPLDTALERQNSLKDDGYTIAVGCSTLGEAENTVIVQELLDYMGKQKRAKATDLADSAHRMDKAISSDDDRATGEVIAPYVYEGDCAVRGVALWKKLA